MTKTINYQQLVKMRACREGLKRFEAAFGKEADVSITVENCERMYFTDVEWLVDQLLGRCKRRAWPRPAFKHIRTRYDRAYKSMLDAYQRAHMSIRDAYTPAIESSRDGYISAYTAAIRPEYERARKSIWNKYESTHKSIWDEYMRDFITKFCEVVNNEELSI